MERVRAQAAVFTRVELRLHIVAHRHAAKPPRLQYQQQIRLGEQRVHLPERAVEHGIRAPMVFGARALRYGGWFFSAREADLRSSMDATSNFAKPSRWNIATYVRKRISSHAVLSARPVFQDHPPPPLPNAQRAHSFARDVGGCVETRLPS